MAFPRYNEEGYNRRGQRKIGGKPRTTAPSFGGLDEYYANQQPGVSSFPTGEGGAPSAGELANSVRRSGMSIGRGGVLLPRGHSQFQRMIQDAQERQRNPRQKSPVLIAGSQTVPGPTGAPMQIPSFQAMQPGRVSRISSAAQAPTPEQNRASLQQRAQGLGLQRDVQRAQSGVVSEAPGGGKILTSRYGTGSSTNVAPGERKEGLINGRPASEVLQGIANAQGRAGTSRPGDKYQPQPEMSSADDARLRKAQAAARIPKRRTA